MAFVGGEGCVGGCGGDIICEVYIVFVPDIVKGVGITIVGVIVGAIRTGRGRVSIIGEI